MKRNKNIILFVIVIFLIQSTFVCLAVTQTDSISIKSNTADSIENNQLLSVYQGKTEALYMKERESLLNWTFAGLCALVTILGGLVPLLLMRELRKREDKFNEETTKKESEYTAKFDKDRKEFTQKFESDKSRFTTDLNNLISQIADIGSIVKSIREKLPITNVSETLDENVSKAFLLSEKHKRSGQIIAEKEMLISSDVDFNNLFISYINGIKLKDKKLINVVLMELEKMISNVKYANKLFKIHQYIGFIYGDDRDGRQAISYEKAVEHYKRCLALDSIQDDDKENIYWIYNDLGYAIGMIGKEKLEVNEQKKIYEDAINYFDMSIKQNIIWANPYKNKGYFLGQLAKIKKGKVQRELYIRAFTSYQIAFGISPVPDNSFDKLYTETLQDYLTSI